MIHLNEYLIATGAAILGVLAVIPAEATPTPEQLGDRKSVV